MSIGDIFGDSKWEILKDLSEKKLSPMQLAEKYKTTQGNIGHQLRLLEAYGLIKKEKLPNRDRGKPRTLFSLAYDCAYMVSAASGLAQKKLLKLSPYHDAILRMWFIDNHEFHYPLQKFFWKIEDHIDLIDGIAVKIVSEDDIRVAILTPNIPILAKLIGKEMIIRNQKKMQLAFKISYIGKDELGKFADIRDYNILYDPNKVLCCYKASL